MDIEKIISDITKDIVNQMKNPPTNKSVEISKITSKGKKVLILFCGSKENGSLINNFISKYNNFEKFYALSASAKSMGIDKFFNLSDAILIDIYPENLHDFIAGFEEIIIPNLTINTAGKLANFINDNNITVFALEAIRQGKKISALKNEIDEYIKNASNFYKMELSEIINKLTRFGLDFVENHENSSSYTFISPNLVNVQAPTSSTAFHNCSHYENCKGCGHCVTNIKPNVNKIVAEGASRITTAAGVPNVDATLAKFIDHTLLKPDATEEQIRKLCSGAAKYKFASVCVNPSWIKLCAELLRGSGVMVCTVVGFPLGATSTLAKANETKQAVIDGADEIDMVINIGALKSKNLKFVENDIRSVVQAASPKTVKVILETSLLTDEEKVIASVISKAAGAHFVKTSTGFGGGGATAEDIALMRKSVGELMGVKASGGVKDYETAKKMISAGATRIGASASISIVTKQAVADKKGY